CGVDGLEAEGDCCLQVAGHPGHDALLGHVLGVLALTFEAQVKHLVGVLERTATAGWTLEILDLDQARPDRRQMGPVGNIVEDLLHWCVNDNTLLELQHYCWAFLPWFKNRRDRPRWGQRILLAAFQIAERPPNTRPGDAVDLWDLQVGLDTVFQR